MRVVEAEAPLARGWAAEAATATVPTLLITRLVLLPLPRRRTPAATSWLLYALVLQSREVGGKIIIEQVCPLCDSTVSLVGGRGGFEDYNNRTGVPIG